MWDVAIIGAGPAGVSAALTLAMRNRDIALFGPSSLSGKVRSAHRVANYPGCPTQSGAQLMDTMALQLKERSIAVTARTIDHVYPMGDHFSLTSGSDLWEARHIILATGVDFARPIPGEMEWLGQGVSYCATCDGMFFRGKRVAVVGSMPEAEEEVAFLASIASSVVYVPQYATITHTFSDTVQVRRGVPLQLDRKPDGFHMTLKEGEIVADGIFLLRNAIQPSALVTGLSAPNGHIEVNRHMETALAGCFAAGDLTGTPYQIAKAVGEGNVAALRAIEA